MSHGYRVKETQRHIDTESQCHKVTMSQSLNVTESQCHRVTESHCTSSGREDISALSHLPDGAGVSVDTLRQRRQAELSFMCERLRGWESLSHVDYEH